ncbi:MAG TPA: hypothetical protein VGM33_13140 [Baekduia sp.]|jgi:hypothetical protein
MRKIPVWSAVAVVAALLGAAPAPAAQLTVVNAGQPGYAPVLGVAAAGAADRGPCAQPLTAREANGTPSPCGPGAWPPIGNAWSPVALPVAGGDRLLLHLDATPDEVRYSITTNIPPGWQIPGSIPWPGSGPPTPGRPALNTAVVAPAAAVAPAPGVPDWSLVVPHLPLLGRPVDLAVTARTGTTWASYGVALMTPRALGSAPICSAMLFDGDEPPVPCAPVKGPPPGFGPSIQGPQPPTLTVARTPRLHAGVVTFALDAVTAGRASLTLTRTGHRAVLAHVERMLATGTTVVRLRVRAATLRRLVARHAASLTYRADFFPLHSGAAAPVRGTIALPRAR